MSAQLSAVLIAILVWWAATGLVFVGARLAERSRTGVTIAMSLLAGGSLYAMFAGSSLETSTGSYLGFFGALGVWAWHEMAFLTGLLTGPNQSPCPPGISGSARFWAAFRTVRSHEYAILATAVLLVALFHDAANRTGLWVFLLLWAMRISAKLNIFLGTPNSVSALMPDRLAYLTSYFRTDHTSAFFTASVLASTVTLLFTCQAAFGAVEAHHATGYAILASFLALAIIEHFFLVLPIADLALWTWAFPQNNPANLSEKRRNSVTAPQLGGR